MRRLLHNIGWLYSCDARDLVLRDAHVVVEDGRIAALGPGRPDGDFDQTEDLDGALLVPGFVNVHHHFFQTLTRAVPAMLRGHLIEWLYRMYPVWAGMTPDDLGHATEAGLAQLLLTGATTSVDHSYLVPGADPAFGAAQIAAARDMGARLTLIRGSLTALESDLEARLTRILGPRAGGLVDDPAAVLADMRRLLEDCHDTAPGAMVQIGLGPTTATLDDPAYMGEVARLAAEHGAPLHIHFHPRPDERAACAARGLTPLDFLAARGWLTDRTWLAHATRLTTEEMARCGAMGVSVAHCPRMILRLGARVTPVHDMLAAGMKVGIGVDGGASNDSGSMLGELRVAQLLHRVAGGEGEVPWQDWLSPYRLLCMATREGAAIIGRDDIGRIAPGLCADLAAFRIRGVAYAGAATDPLAALFLTGDDDRAGFVMAAGRVVVRNRRLVGQDEDRIAGRVDAATARLLARAAALTGTDYGKFA